MDVQLYMVLTLNLFHKVMNATTSPALSASQLDGYLLNIAKMFSVKWTPEPQRQEMYAFPDSLSA
jgi:hypothetical protein